MKITDVKNLILKCLRCDHEWLRRTLDKLPARCPGCNSPYWNQPRREPSDNPDAAYQRARRAGKPRAMKAALKKKKAAPAK